MKKIKKALMYSCVLYMFLSCVEKEQLTPSEFYTSSIPVRNPTDSTWAENIKNGKSFLISLGNKPDSVLNGLEILLKPIDYKNKNYSISFIYHKNAFVKYFEQRQKTDPSLSVFGVAIGIGTINSSNVESSLIPGSIEIINKKHPNSLVKAIDITQMSEKFTYEDIKTINPLYIGAFQKEYLFSGSQKLIIRFERGENRYFDRQTLIFDPLELAK